MTGNSKKGRGVNKLVAGLENRKKGHKGGGVEEKGREGK